MKRVLFNILFFLFSVFSISSMTSCGTMLATTQYDDIYTDIDNVNVDVRVIFRYGTPYYYNGILNYYVYDGIYWYPFWYENMWYFRPYRRPYRLGYIPPYRGWRPPVYYRGWYAGRYGFDRPTGRYYGMPYRRGYHGNRYDRRYDYRYDYNRTRTFGNGRRSWDSPSRSVPKQEGTFGRGRRFGQGSTIPNMQQSKPNRQSGDVSRSGGFKGGGRFGGGRR